MPAAGSSHAPRTDRAAETSDPSPSWFWRLRCQRDGAPGSGSGEASGGPHTVPSAVPPRGCGQRAGSSRDTSESTNALRGPRRPDLICSLPAARAPRWSGLRMWIRGTDSVPRSWLPRSAPPQGRGTFVSGSSAIQGQEDKGGCGHRVSRGHVAGGRVCPRLPRRRGVTVSWGSGGGRAPVLGWMVPGGFHVCPRTVNWGRGVPDPPGGRHPQVCPLSLRMGVPLSSLRPSVMTRCERASASILPSRGGRLTHIRGTCGREVWLVLCSVLLFTRACLPLVSRRARTVGCGRASVA